MVLLSIKKYFYLSDPIEIKLNEADFQTKHSDIRLTHKEVFDSIRKAIHEK